MMLHKVQKCTQARVVDSVLPRIPKRLVATSTSAQPNKPSGDISSVFPSLSGVESPPLPPTFTELKRRLIQGHEDRVRDSWHRLLAALRQEVDVIKALGSNVIPELEFRDMHDMERRTAFRDGLRKRGVGLVRGVVSEKEALGWKQLVKRYIQNNPLTKGRQSSGSFCWRSLEFWPKTIDRCLRLLHSLGYTFSYASSPEPPNVASMRGVSFTNKHEMIISYFKLQAKINLESSVMSLYKDLALLVFWSSLCVNISFGSRVSGCEPCCIRTLLVSFPSPRPRSSQPPSNPSVSHVPLALCQ